MRLRDFQDYRDQIVFAGTMLLGAVAIGFALGERHQQLRAEPPRACPVIDRVATYSTDELRRIVATRTRMERVK